MMGFCLRLLSEGGGGVAIFDVGSGNGQGQCYMVEVSAISA
jgi:hypothetical protein